MPRLIKDPVRYKTALCQKWEACGACPYKHKCQFAHGIAELRTRVEPAADSSTPVCVAIGAPATTPTLKERTVALCNRLKLHPDTNIIYTIATASAMLGVQDRVHALPTLPEKMELLCSLAAVPGRASPARPPSPLSVTMLPPPMLVPSPTVVAPPPPPPSPVEAPRPVRPSRNDESKSLSMLQRQPEEDEEPFGFNARTGKLEARGCSAPLPTREASHATEMVRRTVSFILELDEPSADGLSYGLGAQTSIWGAPTPQPWAACSMYGRQAAAGAA